MRPVRGSIRTRPVERAQIYERLESIFLDVLDLDVVEIRDATTAGDVEGWDSVAHIRLLLAVEAEFGFCFDTAEVPRLRNVGDLVSRIEQIARS